VTDPGQDGKAPSPQGEGNGDPRFQGSRFKEFGITSLAVGNRTAVLVLLVMITVGGLASYLSIPKESSPAIEIPMIAVNTLYPGVSPSDMESLVTRPIEEELNRIADLKELTSTSVEGYSSVVAEFETGVVIEDALARVREKVDLARSKLPSDAEDPSIMEFDFSEVPIMQVNLSGEYGLVRLKDIGEELQDRIEQIPSVLRVDLRGGLEREVKVDVDLPKLKFYGVAMSDIVDAIRNENVNIPGGSIEAGTLNYLVRVDGEFRDPSLLGDIVVTTSGGRPIYIRDVADVEFAFADRDSYARLDEAPVITLDVIKRSGDNIIETAEAVRSAVAGMESLFPPTTVVKITSDQSEDIYEMVSSLENNIISGLILIVMVLLFFLGIRNSLFVAVAIPTSMLLSFMVLGVLGITMNMVVLFSLILALGMLVDNAIVVVENIYRYMEEGWSRIEAAKKATGEVAVPIIAATATTLAAFAPLLFWPGIAGEFMKYLPLTLIVTLSSSLFVALIIVPTLCAMFMRLETEPRPPLTRPAKFTLLGLGAVVLLALAAVNWLTMVLLVATAAILVVAHRLFLDRAGRAFQFRTLPVLVDRYEGSLRWALNHRLATILGSVAVLVLTVAAFTRFNSGVEYFPESIPPAQIWVTVEAPTGTRAETTDAVAQRLEQLVKDYEGFADVQSKVATVGGGGGSGDAMMGGGPSGPEAGRITLSFVDFNERQFDAFDYLAMLQEELGTQVAGAEVTVDKPTDGPPSGPPVNLEIVGEDPAAIQRLSNEVIAILRDAPVFSKLVGLESDLDDARPELTVEVDREKAALFGLNTTDVGMAVRGAIQGIEAAKYRTGNDEFDIIVRLAESYRNDLDALADLTVVAEGGTQIPLLSVATWQLQQGAGSIRRKDMDRVATVSSDVRAGLNSNAVLGEVKLALADFEASLPPGYELRYTGQTEEQDEAVAFLGTAFLVALFLIAFILVSQFNSVVKPVIILTSVIMSTAGVLLGLMVFQMPFGIIMTGVGVISLAGIVVNNAIVLIDYVDILRDRDGMNRREALVQGGRTRFRPVVLTAITTALGLVPLAIGLNFDFLGLYSSLSPDLYWGGEQAAWWGPMAIAVIAGIIFATFLTLILVPVMYSLVDDSTRVFRRYFVQPEEEEPAVVEPVVPSGRRPAVPQPADEREPAGVYRSPLQGPEMSPQGD
jgi:multidrug efflux pump